MSDTTMDPKAIAHAVAITVADEEGLVGGFVQAVDLEDNVTDFRFESRVRGYEGWQWSVTLYHDVELDHWTVNESSLVPTDEALRPPKWIPWKDRLEPGDLAVTDSIGTDPDDPRMEDGFRKTLDNGSDEKGTGSVPVDEAERNLETDDETVRNASMPDDVAESDQPLTSEEDIDEAVEEFDLSRRHVMTPLGRSQTAKRWYEGPHGPKSLSTKTAEGNPCSTCGFFIPLKGELNLLFGVCANKWSPDDGRVVSIDHGCGEHSEIDPPEPSHLWVQSKPAFDDMHIDIIAQAPRDERGSVELIEQLSSDDSHNPNADEDGTEADIEANTIDDDASQEDVLEHASFEDAPEVETTVTIQETEPETEEGSTQPKTETVVPVESETDGMVETDVVESEVESVTATVKSVTEQSQEPVQQTALESDESENRIETASSLTDATAESIEADSAAQGENDE